MEIIGGKDEGQEKAEGAGLAGGAGDAGQPVPAQEKRPALVADLSTPGIMRLEINVEALSYHQESIDQFVGFMERHKSWALMQAVGFAKQRAEIKAAVMKDSAKVGMRGFLNGLRKR